MNQQQKNYIRKRVNDILNIKTSEARQKFQINAKTLTNEERIHLIRQGKVKLKPPSALRAIGNYGININSVFDFSKFESQGKFNQAAYSKYLKELRTKANDVTDKVMLGPDAEEALKMLKDFEAYEG